MHGTCYVLPLHMFMIFFHNDLGVHVLIALYYTAHHAMCTVVIFLFIESDNVLEIALAVVGTALLMIVIGLGVVCGIYVYNRSVRRKRG